MKTLLRCLLACVAAGSLTLAAAPTAGAYSGTTGKGCTQYVYGQGGTGTCVQRIQRMLNGISSVYSYGGTRLAVDGSFGPATTTHAKRFQKFAGLVVDGRWGPKTWNEACHYAGQVNFAYSSSSAAKRTAWQAAYDAGCYVEKPSSNSIGYVTISRY